jgi:4-hydroxy-tetrahydrodipicolinate synthase
MKTITQKDMKGLFIPLLTPMKYGDFDQESMKALIKSVENTVDGFIPCLSTGEGNVLSDEQWVEVVSYVHSATEKPVIAGIKRDSIESTILLAKKAEEIGCEGFIIPVPSNDWEVTKSYFEHVINQTTLPFVIYNTETAHIDSIENLKELDNSGRIVSIKDSSMNREFFGEMCNARLEGDLNMSVLQGMEHHLDVPKGCDGYLVSLLNVEKDLVREMFENPTQETLKKIYKVFMQYNLGSDWFITLKAILLSRGIISSAEQVQQFVNLDEEILKELRSENKAPRENFELKGLK